MHTHTHPYSITYSPTAHPMHIPQVEEIKKFREEMVTMIQELKDKQERVQVLGDEMKKLPRNINRALYTHRIMDIIASIGQFAYTHLCTHTHACTRLVSQPYPHRLTHWYSIANGA